MLNLCQADSEMQHQNPIKTNHHSIAVAKSSTTEKPNRVFAKLGMHFKFLKRYDINLFLNRRELGQNGPHQVNHSKLWDHEKQSCGQSVFFYLSTDGQN